MRLRGKVDQRPGFLFVKDLLYQPTIANISLDKAHARRTDIGDVLQIAGVGQFVEIDNAVIRSGRQQSYEITADKSATAGDQYRFHLFG
jgi:hypothetical protein